MKIIESLSNWLAVQLDKLKIGNPIVFGIVQVIILYISGLFAEGKIVIPSPEFLITALGYVGIENGLNGLISGILLLLVAANGARTAVRVSAVKKDKEAKAAK